MSATLLVAELGSLASETKRKNPEVKAAAEAALVALRANPESVLRSVAHDTGPADQNLLLKPITLACATRNPKAVALSVATLQRIISMRVVPNNAIAAIVSTLRDILGQGVDIQLKILQAVASLLTSYQDIHNELLAETLLLCFKLQDSRVAVVSSTAAATLRQAVMAIFDKVAEEDNILDSIKDGGEDAAAAAPLAAHTVQLPSHEAVTLFPCSKDAYLTFEDLCALANGDSANFLQLQSLPRTFALELIESVLTDHIRLFRSHPELLLILRQSTCPLLIKALSEKPTFPATLRLMRVLFLLLRQFSTELVVEVEILMSILLKIIQAGEDTQGGGAHPTPPLWQRVLAMEVARSLCSDGELLRNLWRWYDSSSSPTRVFTSLISALHRIATENPGLLGTSSEQMTGSAAAPSRQSTDRGYGGIYEAAAGVASATMSGVTGMMSQDTSNAGMSLASAPSMQVIDQLDKAEAPATPSTYVFLLALQSLVCLAQSFANYVLPQYSAFANARPASASRAPPRLDFSALPEKQQQEMERVRAMAEAAWPGLLASFTFFLTTKCDDFLFCDVLTAVRNLTNVFGVLGLEIPRNAFISSLSKFAVPPPVVLAVAERTSGASEPASGGFSASFSERNLACLKALCQVAYYLSGSLGSHWLDLLEPLQDAEFVLHRTGSTHRRKASAGSAAGVSSPISPFATGLASAIDSSTGRPQLMSDLDAEVLQSDIKRVFENTTALDAEAFVHFLTALCKLSAVSAGGAAAADTAPRSPQKRRPSGPTGLRLSSAEKSFSMASLRLVATLNIERLVNSLPDLGWSIVMNHLLFVAGDAGVRPALRIQAAELLDDVLFKALGSHATPSSPEEPKRVQRQVLDALAEQAILDERRATVVDVEVRRMGNETLHRILEAFGHSLLLGWETIFTVCSKACGTDTTSAAKSSKPLVRVAFSSLQLVCTDFLSALSIAQLKLCVQSLTEFSTQMEDVNVALTANGTLWGVTAEMWARWNASARSNACKPVEGDGEADSLKELWMYLLHCVLRVCGDARAEVRNGAISSLFRVLEQYGESLDEAVWEKIMWEVLFPLLKTLDATAQQAEEGDEAEDQKASMMGAEQSPSKQWHESRVLAFNSIGRVIGDYLTSKLILAGDFESVWNQLLDHIKLSFIRGPGAISQAALRSLELVLKVDVSKPDVDRAIIKKAWLCAWEAWREIGQAVATPPAPDKSPYTQANLQVYVETFTQLYRVLVADFDLEKLGGLLVCLKNCINYASSPDNVPDVDALTPLQGAILKTLSSLNVRYGLPSLVLADLAEYVTLAFTPALDAPIRAASEKPTRQPIALTYIALTKAAMQELLHSYMRWKGELEIYTSGAVEKLFTSLLLPIKLKYECPKPSRHGKDAPLWQTATLTFCKIVRECCAEMERESERLDDQHYQGLWRHLLAVCQASLTADCSLALDLDLEQQERDEVFDLTLLSVLERDILPHLGGARVPSELIVQLGGTLARATRLYEFDYGGDIAASMAQHELGESGKGKGNTSERDDLNGGAQHGTTAPITELPRERFSYWVFDLLFLVCSDRLQDHVAERRRVAALCLPALLSRGSTALASYVTDAPLRGMTPFSRLREEELNYILAGFLDLRLWPGSLWAAFSDDPSGNAGKAPESLAGPPSPAVLRSATRQSTRAHLFHTYSTLADLLSVRTPSGSPPTLATAGTSLQMSVPVELAEGFELGLVGRPNVLASARLDRDGPIDMQVLARGCLGLVASELGLN